MQGQHEARGEHEARVMREEKGAKKKMLCSWYICPLLARDSCLPSIAWKVQTNSPVLKATHLTSKVYPEANCRTTEIKLEWGLMKTISRCWFELCLYNVFCRSENDNESFSTQWACSWIEELCFSATFPWITNLTAIKYSNTYTLLESSTLTPERKAEKTCCTKKLIRSDGNSKRTEELWSRLGVAAARFNGAREITRVKQIVSFSRACYLRLDNAWIL